MSFRLIEILVILNFLNHLRVIQKWHHREEGQRVPEEKVTRERLTREEREVVIQNSDITHSTFYTGHFS